MILLAKLFILLNQAILWSLKFRVIKRGSLIPPRWELAHHEIEGRNGGILLIPRENGILWSDRFGKRFRLIMKLRKE